MSYWRVSRMSADDAKKWVVELVRHVREEVERFPELEKGLSNLDWLLSPCQVVVLWFVQPEVQAFIITHFDDVPDLSVEVFGPVEAYRFLEVVEKVANMEWWNRPLPEEHDFRWCESYRDLVEDYVLIDLKRYLKTAVFSVPLEMPVIGPKYALTFAGRDSVWIVMGNIFKRDPRGVAAEIIESARGSLKLRTHQEVKTVKAAEKAPRGRVIQGFGTYIYPFVWIEDVTKLTLREKLAGDIEILWRTKLQRKVTEFELLSLRVLVFNDGFVFVETKEVAKAVKVLDLIAASMLLSGLPALACRSVDLLEAEYDEEMRGFRGIGGKPFNIRASALFDSGIIGRRLFDVKIGLENVLKLSELNSIISLAKALSKDEELLNLLRFWVRAYTHLDLGEYREAFLSAWSIVEYWINGLWRSLLESSTSLKKEALRKLNDPSYMSLDHIINLLYIMKKVDEDLYGKLMRLKRVRNDIVHKFYEPTEDEVKRAFDLSTEIVKDIVSKIKAE